MSAKYLNTVNADSTPVYGWIWDYWDQADWIQWHKKLVERYGSTAANEIFIKAWNDSPPFARNIGFRNSAFSDNTNFITYAQQKKFYDQLFAGFFGTLFYAQSTALSATKDITTAVGDIASSTKTMSSYVLPVALVLGIVILYFYSKKLKLI